LSLNLFSTAPKGELILSKGARKRETREEDIRKQQIAAENKSNNRKSNTIVVVAVVALALVVALGSIISAYAYNAYLDSGDPLRNTIVLKSANNSVDNAMMSYYIYDTYYAVLGAYSDMLASWGFDPSLPLRDQEYSPGMSWFEYFASSAVSMSNQMLVLAEAAEKNGVKLTEEEIASIEEQVAALDPSLFGRGVKAEDIIRAKKLSLIASKYDEVILASIDTSEKAINEYFEANKADIVKATYMLYSFYYKEDGSEGAYTKEQAKAFADSLAKVKTEEEYTQWLRDYFKEHEPDFDSSIIEAEIAYSHVTDSTYTDEYESLVWAYDESRVTGDTYIEHDDGYKCYSVYMILKPATVDKSITKNVRHILIATEDFGTAEKAHAEAQKIYDEWKKTAATEDTFAEFAKKYSTDPGSVNEGGLYENVTEGMMVPTFNDWCFDESRKKGDTGLVDTSYGTHIMYFVGDGLMAYQAELAETILNKGYSDIYTKLASEFVIKQDTGKVDSIPDIIK